MFKHLRKVILSFVFVVASTCWLFSRPHITMTPLLYNLLEDMGLYQLEAQGDPYLHAGDLWHHSVWTYNKMVQLLKSDSPYVQGLTLSERQQEVVALAALLHDVGKAGRYELLTEGPFQEPSYYEPATLQLRYQVISGISSFVNRVIYYQDRQVHPRIGFEYAAGRRDYCMLDRKTGDFGSFDMLAMYKELGLTDEEQKLIAVLIGIHYEFGNLKHKKMTSEQLLKKLAGLVQEVNYNNGILTEETVRLSILIQVADVGGLVQVPAQCTPLFPHGISCVATHSPIKFVEPLKALDYECCSGEPINVGVMRELLECFRAPKQ